MFSQCATMAGFPIITSTLCQIAITKAVVKKNNQLKLVYFLLYKQELKIVVYMIVSNNNGLTTRDYIG